MTNVTRFPSPERSPFMELWNLGYRRLVPIIPPGAAMHPRSYMARRVGTKTDPRGKAPGVLYPDGWAGLGHWHTYDCNEDDLARWFGMGAGVGIKTGKGLVGIDADTLIPEWAEIIRGAVERRFGIPPCRIGNAPKAMYVLRVSGEFRYSRVDFGPLVDGVKPNRVEILSDGRQFVAHGIHPKTMRRYEWTEELVPFDELPEVEPEALTAFLDELRGLLPDCGPVNREGGTAVVSQESLRGSPEQVRRAVESIPNTSAQFPTRESYRDMGYAIKAALPDLEGEALMIWMDWCSRWDGGVNAQETLESDWRRMQPPFRRGATWLYETAARLSGGKFSAASVWFEPVTEFESVFGRDAWEDGSAGSGGDKVKPPLGSPYRFPEPSAIPRRESLYGGHYIRKFLSVTVAPSKVGKSSLAIAEALAMASGKALLGVRPRGACRVWWWNGEDPLEELERRVAATMMHYGLTREDVGDRLLLDTGRVSPLVLVRADRSGSAVDRAVYNEIVRTILDRQVDCFLPDPLVSIHRVPENDNSGMEIVGKTLAEIAGITNSAVEAPHHTRKLNGAEASVEDARGASALIAASRSARALARMTAQEAEKFGLTDRYRRLFRFADASSNLFVPANDATEQWFELVSVALGNGPGEGLEKLTGGDSVGVVARFDMPTTDERAMAALREVEAGMSARGLGGDGRARALDMMRKGEWREDARADVWAGKAIAGAFGLSIDDRDDRRRIKLVLDDMVARGELVRVSRMDQARRPRVYLEPRPEGASAVLELGL